MQIQISWLLQKPTDLDLHCLQRQGISGFSMTRVKAQNASVQNQKPLSLSMWMPLWIHGLCLIKTAFISVLDGYSSQKHAYIILTPLNPTFRGWSGGAKVLCILHHWGVQLILAYSWARPAILVVGKGRGGMFLFLLFLHFLSCSSFFPVPLFHLLYYLFSPFLWETTQNDPQGLTCR